MADKSLQVTISADVSSLQAKSAVAKSELGSLNAEVKSLANQFRSASDDMKGSLEAELEQTVAKAAAVKAEIASLNKEISELSHSGAGGFFGSLSTSMTEATEKVEGLTQKFAAVGRLASSLGEFVLAGLAVEQVGEAINHVAETGEGLLKLSEETGLTTEQLSGLKTMATLTGTDFDQFTTLLQRLPNTLQEAAIDPAGKAGEAFAAMGVKVTGANGQIRPMGDILDEVSAKLASYQDGADKTALETDIFGSKIGANLIPMLNELGQVGLEGAIVQSNRLNQTWTDESAQAAEQYEQDMHRAALAVEGIADSIVRFLLPALDAVANMMAPTLDSQIASVEGTLQQLRGRALAMKPELQAQLAQLEAQKAALDASAGKQSAVSGGAAPGTVAAPTLAPKSSAGPDVLAQDQATLAQQNAQIEATATSTKEANEEKLQNTVQYWEGVLAAGNLSSKQELQVQTDLAKAETALRSQQLSGASGAAKSAESEQTQIAKDAAEARKQIAQSEYETKVQFWDSEVTSGKMSKAQEVQDEIAAQQQMYAAALAEAEKETALDTAGTAAKAKALDDIAVMQAQHVELMAQLNNQLVTAQTETANKAAEVQAAAAAKTTQAWQKAFAPINQAFDSSINGVIQGTQTLQNAEAKAAQSIALAFIDAEAKKVLAFAEGEAQIAVTALASQLKITAAVQAGQAVQTATKAAGSAEGKSIDAATSSATIVNNAHTAFTGAFSAVAGIPYVGPVLAPVAGAAAFAAVMAMDVLSAAGGLQVGAGEEPLVQLHENETVLPAHIAMPFQAMMANGGVNDNSSGDTHYHNTFNQTVNGGPGGMSPEAIMSALNDQVRSGAVQNYPAIARMVRR